VPRRSAAARYGTRTKWNGRIDFYGFCKLSGISGYSCDIAEVPIKGYIRVSKVDGSQVLDRQRDVMAAAGVPARDIYSDSVDGEWEDRPGLTACLKALSPGDTLVVCKLDRLGHNLRHLVKVVHSLAERGVALRVLTGEGMAVDPTTAAGKLVIGIFTALAEFEREVISERTRFDVVSPRTRGRKDSRVTPAMLKLAVTEMRKKNTVVADLCKVLGIDRSTLYRHVSPSGELRPAGKHVLATSARSLSNESNHLRHQVEKFLATVGSATNGDASEK
jgi:DNA invertase Pin-like site-specific DNA recombinase